MRFLADLRDSLLHLAYPHLCSGCGSDALSTDVPLCLRCLSGLPLTGFERHPYNPVDRLFWGRLPLHAATAQYYFSKESLIQRLMHRIKYGGGQELATYMGSLMGQRLAEVPRYDTIDALVPLPLHRSRLKKRGYNQAQLLCEGMASAWNKPVWGDATERTSATETQTRKGRVARWQNMDGRFSIPDPARLEGRHLLLVDDVVTTGATLEACGRALLAVPGVTLSIATLCFAAG
ncbi:MAG: ComF family protein [Chitinophagaceae bacterium]|nr:MAG: ComF family protein [Chitinophagaceae bacterium]